MHYELIFVNRFSCTKLKLTIEIFRDQYHTILLVGGQVMFYYFSSIGRLVRGLFIILINVEALHSQL